MNRENQSPLGRLAASTVAVLALLATSLGLVTVAAAPASAETKYGYAKVVTKESYLPAYIGDGVEILHVDTEHATADGFWLAVKSPLHARGFGWTFQPYGLWCADPAMKVAFNGWMNTHKCVADPAAVTATNGPAWEQNTANCRASTGLPWKEGSIFAGATGCTNAALSWAGTGTEMESPVETACASFEPTGLDKNGAPLCTQVRYAWESGASNAMWLPAPDTCTGMPADSNRVIRNADTYAPASGGDGSCTGAAKAPNCTTGSKHPGCTGVEETAPVSATRTVTATASNVPGSATAERTATASAVVEKVKRTASRKFRGKRVSASATKSIVKQATVTRSVTASATDQATRSATMSCTASTSTEAAACATEKAQAEAHRLAYADAEVLARAKAATLAATQAQQAAETAAQQAAQASPVTAEERGAASKIALRKAERKLQRKINRMRRR